MALLSSEVEVREPHARVQNACGLSKRPASAAVEQQGRAPCQTFWRHSVKTRRQSGWSP